MKRLPKYTPAEVRNDPYGFTYKEMSEVIGENEAKALYEDVLPPNCQAEKARGFELISTCAGDLYSKAECK